MNKKDWTLRGAQGLERKSLQALRRMAKSGDSFAKVEIVLRKAESGSLSKLRTKDIEQLRSAVRNGDPRACVTLAAVGEERGFLAKSTAIKLYIVGAKSDIPEAHFNLGNLYTSSPNFRIQKLGFRHLLVAAKHNIPEAQSNLGYCLENGIGAKRDTKSAVKRYMMAFDLGMSEALSFALNVRIESTSSPTALNRVRKDLEKWKKKGVVIRKGTLLRLELKSVLISREWLNLKKILSETKSKTNDLGLELASIVANLERA